MAAPTFIVFNGAMPTTAAIAPITTGTAIKTMLQLKPATGQIIRPVAWGCSFNGASAAVPGKVELIETDVSATAVTAYAAADVMPYGNANVAANTAGTSGVPLNLGTTHSGYTSSSTEGTITATRIADYHQIAPTSDYWMQWPLGREFECIPQKWLRVRATFAVAVDMVCWVIFEV